MKTMKLSQCTDLIVRGVNILKPKDESETTSYYEIKIKNIINNEISLSEQDIQENGRKTQIQSKKLEYGDIIFPVRGRFSKAILFDLDLDLPCVVSHHFWIIRPNQKIINSYYLLFFLLSIKDEMNNDERNILASKRKKPPFINTHYYIKLFSDSEPIEITALLNGDIDINDEMANTLYVDKDNIFKSIQDLKNENTDISSEMIKKLHIKSISKDNKVEFINLDKLITGDEDIGEKLKSIVYLPVGSLARPSGLKSLELLEKEADKKSINISVSTEMLKNIDVPIIDKEKQTKMKEVYNFSQKLPQYADRLVKFNDSISENIISLPSHYSVESLQPIMKDIENTMNNIESL